MVTTIKRATKKASLHIYALRSIYKIVSVCNKKIFPRSGLKREHESKQMLEHGRNDRVSST